MEKVLELMKRMGEETSSRNYWDYLITDYPIILQEGLIKSYDSRLVFNSICDSFHLRKNGKATEHILLKMQGEEYVYIGDAFHNKGENGEDNISISLDGNENFITKIEEKFNSYGWSLFRKDETLDGKTIFLFEKRYPTSFQVKNLLSIGKEEIYHITNDRLRNKILKQGLIPKESKYIGFQNEPRIYFWINEEDVFDSVNNLKSNEKNILLKINLSELNLEHKFYIDHRLHNAIFSLEPIPPKAITIIETIV